MPVVRFTALRSLTAGVSSGTLTTYDLPVAYAGLVRTRAVFATQRRSLSGKREAYFESEEDSWSVQTRPLTASQAASLVMFLDSVGRGEQFEFDPAHAAADGGSISYLDCVLSALGYTEPLNPALDSMKSYSFGIVEVP